MKFFQRATALLLAAILLLGQFPVSAGASQQELPQFQTTHINPLYADVVTEEDLPEPSPSVQTYAAANYVDTIEEAGAVLREQMADWLETATVYLFTTTLISSNEELGALGGEILDAAFVHTGVPKEGDYLNWHYAGCTIGCNGDYADDGYNYILTFNLSYHSTAAQEAELDEAVEDLLNDLNLDSKSDYQKAKAVYDYICANITYDHTSSGMLKHTAYAALVNKAAVCQGYASLYYRLMLDLGVDIRVVAGETDAGEAHGWNIVELDNLYYNADSTWDAGAAEYIWFLRSMANFSDHNRWEEYTTSAFNAAYPMGSTDYEPPVCEVNGHSYGEWYQTKAPTTTEEGQEQRDCANCDAYETRTVDKLTDPYSGTCGKNLTWVYDEDSRTVTISGTGNMYDYSAGSAPWCDMELDASPIKAAVIEDGVTSIGEFAFVTCDSLKTVSIAGSVTTIGSNAFSSSESLSSIVIPEGVISIGESAFRNCYALTSAALPASVTSIGSQAFANCEYLTEISVDAKNPSYSSDASGVLFNKDQTTLVQAPGAISGSYTVPESVTTIGAWAFSGCTELNEITFCSDAPSFGNSAFYRVTATAYYPASNATWTEDVMQDYGGDITWVAYGSDPYSGTCGENLTWHFDAETGTLIISGTGDMTDFDDNVQPWEAFNEQIVIVTLEEGVTSLGVNSLIECEAMTQLNLPASMNNIKSGSFPNVGSLEAIHVDADNQDYCSDNGVLYDKSMESLIKYPAKKAGNAYTLPDSLTTIGFIGFVECSNLKELYFTGNAPTIIDAAFTDTTLTAYYPSNDSTWTESSMKDYGGTITWKPYCPDGHSWDAGVVTKEATESETGIRTYTCEDCGETKTEVIPVIVHTHSWDNGVVTKEATETEPGIRTYTCTTCGETKTEEIPVHVHEYEPVVTDPTCTTQGYTTYTCTCGDSFVENYVDPVEHDWDNGEITKEPTDTETGIRTYTCQDCGEKLYEELPILDHTHNYEITVTEPTCTEQGYTTYTCACGYSYVDNYVDPTGHSFGEWYQTKAPTEEEAGEEQRDCANCDQFETREIEKLTPSDPTSGTCGENVTWAFEESSGTLTISGTESVARSNGNSVMDDYASPEETPWFSYQDQIITVVIESTVDSVGKNAFAGCGNLTTVIIEEGVSEIDSTAFSGCDSLENCYYEGNEEAWDDLGADVGEANIHVESADPETHTETKTTVSPTCTEQGYDLYTCSCGAERKDNIVAATGHSWDEGIVTKEPTAEEPGIKTYTCTVCKETRTEEVPYEAPSDCTVKRISGKDRVKTALSVATALKETLGVEKFEAVVLAIGDNEKFADALAGSYLANVKGAPILLYTSSGLSDLNVAFIEENLVENGTIYLLGGSAAIPDAVKDQLSAYGNVVRLSGKSRYETNLAILKEAGYDKADEILVATGTNFADSLSASAVGLPILLVNGKKTELTAEQIEFLEGLKGTRVTIIGGTGAVSAEIETAIENIVGIDVVRISGKTRHNTSVLIAETYLKNPTCALLTYSQNFPDGLAGGPLAYALGAPLLLTNAGNEAIANEYITENEIDSGYILGGTAAVSDETAKKVFALADNAVITKAYYTE